MFCEGVGMGVRGKPCFHKGRRERDPVGWAGLMSIEWRLGRGTVGHWAGAERVGTHMGYPLSLLLFGRAFMPCHDDWSPEGPHVSRG